MKFSELKRHSVVGVAGARKLGTVDDAVVDLKAQRVLALLVKEGGFLRKEEALPLAAIVGVGGAAVTVHDASDLNDRSKYSDLEGHGTMSEILGAKVVGTDGEELGQVSDVDFDLPLGKITHYVLHEGIIDRLRGEPHHISPDEVRSIGRRLMVVASK